MRDCLKNNDIYYCGLSRKYNLLSIWPCRNNLKFPFLSCYIPVLHELFCTNHHHIMLHESVPSKHTVHTIRLEDQLAACGLDQQFFVLTDENASHPLTITARSNSTSLVIKLQDLYPPIYCILITIDVYKKPVRLHPTNRMFTNPIRGNVQAPWTDAVWP